MGVIFEVGDDNNDLLVPFVQECREISRERINELYYEASLGLISPEQFWRGVGLGADYPDIETEYLDTRLTLDRGFKVAAARLAGRYALGLLSNDIAEWSAYLRRKIRARIASTPRWSAARWVFVSPTSGSSRPSCARRKRRPDNASSSMTIEESSGGKDSGLQDHSLRADA